MLIKTFRVSPLLLAAALLFACQTAKPTSSEVLNESQPNYRVPTRAAKNVPQMVEQIVQGLKLTMVQNVAAIWPSFRWDNLQVLLAYPSQERSYLWTVRPDRLVTVENQALGNRIKGERFLYSESQINGKGTLLLNLEEPLYWIQNDAELIQWWVSLGTHENFHFFGQKQWLWKANPDGGRGTAYPRAATPRFYRHMLYRALANHWKSDNANWGSAAQNLRHARYWYERWKTEFPNEWENSNDRSEGTARYVEDMTKAIMSLTDVGKELSETNLREYLVQHTMPALYVPSEQDMESDGSGDAMLALDYEGYTLGSLVSSMLRFDAAGLGLDLATWNTMIADGRDPVELLLQNSQPLEQTADAALLATLESRIQSTNQKLAPVYDQFIAQWQDPANYVRVRLPRQLLYNGSGNFSPKDFGYLKAIDMWAVQWPGIPHDFVSADGKSEIKVEDGTIFFEADFVILVPRSLFQPTEGVQMVDIPAGGPVSGKLVGRLSSEQDGYFVAE